MRGVSVTDANQSPGTVKASAKRISNFRSLSKETEFDLQMLPGEADLPPPARRVQLSHQLFVAATKTLMIQMVLHIVAMALFDLLKDAKIRSRGPVTLTVYSNTWTDQIRYLMQSGIQFLNQYETQVLSPIHNLAWIANLVRDRLCVFFGPVKAIKLLRVVYLLLRMELFKLRVFLLTNSIAVALIPVQVEALMDVQNRFAEFLFEQQMLERTYEIPAQ